MMRYAVAALGLVCVGLGFWVQVLRLDVAALEKARDDATLATRTAERDHAVLLSEKQSRHAASQQLKEDEHAKETNRLARQRDTERAAAAGLRSKLANATANVGGPVDAATCERDRDRLEAIGELAGEGVDLVVEARHILDQRDADVRNLLGQIAADRESCSPVSAPP